jgi:hypothetical protein
MRSAPPTAKNIDARLIARGRLSAADDGQRSREPDDRDAV